MAWWTVLVWKDVFLDGKQPGAENGSGLPLPRKASGKLLALSAESLRPMNQGLKRSVQRRTSTLCRQRISSSHHADASDDHEGRYQGVLNNYLIPSFGALCLRDVTPMSVQRYLSDLATKTKLHTSHGTKFALSFRAC